MSRGHNRERDVKCKLEAEGWAVVRAAGSMGTCDLVACAGDAVSFHPAWGPPRDNFVRIGPGPVVMLIEVKSTAGGPYERFGPKDRQELLALAQKAGASAWLAYWPPRGNLQWIGSDAWPAKY